MTNTQTPDAAKKRHAMTNTEIRVRQEVLVDWMTRKLLPAMLPLCGLPRHAAALADRAPVDFALGDGYQMSRLATSLRTVRGDLVTRLQVERRWARSLAAQDTPARLRTPVPNRDDTFPHLEEITGFVARTVTTHQVGVLLRSCVELVIDLVVTARGHDDAPPASDGVTALAAVYEDALRELIAGTTAPASRPRVAERAA